MYYNVDVVNIADHSGKSISQKGTSLIGANSADI